MALNFKNLKDPKLGMLDKITFGKLKDCRVCDVIKDYHTYLLWAETQGYMKFQTIVKETILEAKTHALWVEEQQPKDKYQDLYEKVTRQDYDWEDDVPF